MQITILIEPIEGGRFRARAGEPFTLSAEGDSPDVATRHLETLIRNRLGAGGRLAVIDLTNGTRTPLPPPLYLPPLPDDDWFVKEMREAIAENRRLEDEAEKRRLEDGAGG
jgi:hypothetical protein